MVLDEDVKDFSIMAKSLGGLLKPLPCLGRLSFDLVLGKCFGHYLLSIFNPRCTRQKRFLLVAEAATLVEVLLDSPKSLVGDAGLDY